MSQTSPSPSPGSEPASSSPDGRVPTRRWRRRAAWGAPVVVGAAVAGVAAASLVPASATDHPRLPEVSAAQLLADVGSSSTEALSGTVVETARLGLPDLPGSDRSASLDWQSLVTGSHTARVWVDGPDRQRLALLGQLAESDVVHDGSDVWTYSSADRTVTHAVLPDRPDAASTQPEQPLLTPQAAAQRALAAVDPTTAVTVDETAVVAERPVYTLVLTPRDTRSTVRKVTVSVDSATKVPLRVQVFGPGSAAVLETGFTDVTFARPAASVFGFTPPAGATVRQQQLPQHAPEGTAAPTPGDSGARVVGTGWTSVAVLPAGTATDLTSGSGALLGQLASTQPDGSRLVRSALVNVLITTDGRVLAGAVQPALLQQAAQG